MSNQKFRRLRGLFGHGDQRTLSTWSSRRSSVDLVADARVAGAAGFPGGDGRDAEELAPAFPDGALTHTAFLGHVADAPSLVMPSLEVVRGVRGESHRSRSGIAGPFALRRRGDRSVDLPRLPGGQHRPP
jgi:hypothetical protein